jgi:hypothetical protein
MYHAQPFALTGAMPSTPILKRTDGKLFLTLHVLLFTMPWFSSCFRVTR